jgi:hypothetical protein
VILAVLSGFAAGSSTAQTVLPQGIRNILTYDLSKEHTHPQ